MGAIQLLPARVADAIAAGEVVERPASVVKELVENALDAGARRITVEVEKAGLALIRVSDDGSGMDTADAPLAFQRHATSKIKRLEDLEHVMTMGFRGEALPSIAAVSRVRMATRGSGEEAGTEVRVEAGSAPSTKPGAARSGTLVEVRELFYNVPARRKFLKSPAAEAAAIGEAVSSLALANPAVHLRYFLDGREVLNAPPAPEPLDRILAVLGMGVVEHMMAIQASEGSVRLSGHISRVSLTRSSAADQTFIVNGRTVRCKSLSSSVKAAYKGRVMIGRHPVVVLRIDLPPNEVDVNVHPAKAEVRFRHEKELAAFVETAVARALEQEAGVASGPLRSREFSPAAAAPSAPTSGAQTAAATAAHHQAVLASIAQGLSQPGAEELTRVRAALDEAKARASRGTLPPLEPIAQIANKYIIARTPGGMAVVDQHAAAERYSYEALSQSLADGKVEVQQLIDPVVLDLHPRAVEMAAERAQDLAAVGFAVERFGPRGLRVLSVPALMHDHADPQLLHDILTEALQDAGPSPDEELRDKIVAVTACHYSLRAGQAIDFREMARVIENLYRCKNPFHCIHGRPTVIVTSTEDLDKMFKRTGPA